MTFLKTLNSKVHTMIFLKKHKNNFSSKIQKDSKGQTKHKNFPSKIHKSNNTHADTQFYFKTAEFRRKNMIFLQIYTELKRKTTISLRKYTKFMKTWKPSFKNTQWNIFFQIYTEFKKTKNFPSIIYKILNYSVYCMASRSLMAVFMFKRFISVKYFNEIKFCGD